MEFPKSEIEALWCPWRVEYFEIENRNPNFLTEAAQASDDAAHLVITRRKNVFLDSLENSDFIFVIFLNA